MKILGIIPARAGSKGLRDKNIRWLGKKRLYQWPLDTAYKSKVFDKIVISTNISEILKKNHLKKNVVVQERPDILCQDDTSIKDVIKYVILSSDIYYDLFAILQPTSPFLRVGDIHNSVYQFEINSEIHSVQTVRKIKHLDHAYNQRKMDKDGVLKFVFPEHRADVRKQAQPEHFALGNLIMTDTNYFLKTNDLFGVSIGIEIPSIFGLDIDYEDDLELAEALVKPGGMLYGNTF